MRVLIAFDKFKDSLTAGQACDQAARALQDCHCDWRVDLCPLADGGEGFSGILTRAAGGRMRSVQVAGPRSGRVEAPVGIVRLDQVSPSARARLALDPDPDAAGQNENGLAIIEMASASGLALLPPELRDPWQVTSLGTGQLIQAAAELGVVAILLGVGGSATHDLGLGALDALGLKFRAADGRDLHPPVPALWPELTRIEGCVPPSIPPIRIACDVANPLLGPRGAAATFGPQKGLAAVDYDRLESESARIAAMLCKHCGLSNDLVNAAGAGAAGGIAFGLTAAARARLLPGSALVADWLDLDARLAASDLVLTGEGCFDDSSWMGKAPGALAARARALGKPVHLFAGRVETARSEAGITLHSITPAGARLPEALREAGANLTASIRRTFSAPGPSGA